MAKSDADLDDKVRQNVDAAAWLAVLIDARQKNDFEKAAHAQRELSRIGVKVTFGRRGRGQRDANR